MCVAQELHGAPESRPNSGTEQQATSSYSSGRAGRQLDVLWGNNGDLVESRSSRTCEGPGMAGKRYSICNSAIDTVAAREVAGCCFGLANLCDGPFGTMRATPTC